MSCARALRCFASAGALLAAIAAFASSAFAQSVNTEAGDWSIQGGGGFTSDPDGGLVASDIEYSITGDFGVGPSVQLAFDDDVTIVAPTMNLRYRVDLSDVNNEFVRRLEPFGQLGLGFAYIEKDHAGGDDDDTGFLVNGGFGAEYWVTDALAVGNTVLFNGMPDDVEGEEFFFSWQLVTLRYRF
jgi:hypothetical protein